MMSIYGGLQLLQISSKRYWPLDQLSSQPLAVYLLVNLSLTY